MPTDLGTTNKKRKTTYSNSLSSLPTVAPSPKMAPTKPTYKLPVPGVATPQNPFAGQSLASAYDAQAAMNARILVARQKAQANVAKYGQAGTGRGSLWKPLSRVPSPTKDKTTAPWANRGFGGDAPQPQQRARWQEGMSDTELALSSARSKNPLTAATTAGLGLGADPEAPKTNLAKKAQAAQAALARTNWSRLGLGKAGNEVPASMVEAVNMAKALARDPKAWKNDPQGVILANDLVEELAAAVKGTKPQGFGEYAKAAGLGTVALFDVPINEIVMNPFYAGKLSQRRGGGLGRQVNSAISALPGFGFLVGGVSKKDRAAVQTRDQRAALTESGELQSIGQSFSDNLLGPLANKSIGGPGGYKPFKKMHENQSLSGPADVLVQTVLDPINLSPAVTGKLALIGERVAAAAARKAAQEAGVGAFRTAVLRGSMSNTDGYLNALIKTASKGAPEAALPGIRAAATRQVAESVAEARFGFLANTERGKGLIDAAKKVIGLGFDPANPGKASRGLDAASIQKAIPGLDRVVAQEMASASSAEKALEAFRRAFITGEYSPSMSVRRQLLGRGAAELPSGVGLGRRVIREEQGLFDALGWSRQRRRSNAVRSVTGTSSTAAVLAYNTVRSGLARAGERRDDVYAKIAPEVLGLDPIARMERVWEKLKTNPGLADIFEQNLDLAEKSHYSALGVEATLSQRSVDDLLRSEAIEVFLKDQEIIAHLAEGGAGQRARHQVIAEAKFGLGRKAASDTKLLDASLVNAGIRVPSAPPSLKPPKKFKGVAAKVTRSHEAGPNRTVRFKYHAKGPNGEFSGLDVLVDTEAGTATLDTITTPVASHQGKGLGTALLKQAYDELDGKFEIIHTELTADGERLIKSFMSRYPEFGIDPGELTTQAGHAFVAPPGYRSFGALRGEVGRAAVADEVKEGLLREIDRTATLKAPSVGKLDRRVKAVLANKPAQDEFARLLAKQGDLVGAVEEALPAIGLARRMVNSPLKLVNALAEPVSPAHVAFLGYTNTAHAIAQRVEDMDRWFRDLGFDDFTRRLLGDSVARVQAEEDLFKVVNDALRTHAVRQGLPEELLVAIQTKGIAEVKDGMNKMTFARIGDGLVKTDDSVYTLAQRGEVVYLPDPDDIRRTVREFKAMQGDLGAKVRLGLAKPLDLKLFGIHGPVSGELLTVRNFLVAGHRKWKYLTVIPGLELAALGAIVGFAATDGDLGDRFAAAGQASTIGLLSPLRYIVRVAGIEEGLRKYLAGGMNAEMWKVHLSRNATQEGLDRPFTLHNAVRAGDPLGTPASRRLASISGGFDSLEDASGVTAKLFRKDARYLEGYGRILNNQIHPETDLMVDTILRRQAGEITEADAEAIFRSFVPTPAGKLWMRRLRGAVNGPRTPDEAWANYNEFIRTYVPDADVARARLDMAREFAETGVKSDVSKDVLKAAQRRGNALPAVIHAEKTFLAPKNFKEVIKIRDRYTRWAFERPTTKLNRVPMAEAYYRDEYTRLLRNGVEPRRAQEIAEQVAVEKTNKVMFRINDESRFAAKADFIFPFQQPREEMLRVWLPLIANNPARAMHMGNLAAIAFNNGAEKGMLTKDQYGDWRMTVPGSAYLSKLLFNSDSAFNFRVKDLLFFGQGAYGVNFIPSPGGPYWGAASRMLINHNPDWYEGLPEHAKKWMAPYGVTGSIFRPEVSRLWQAWTGEIFPGNFASKVEQTNALNKHRRGIKLLLIWQHGQETGDYTWRPTDQEWDEATSASLKAWSFIGATFPASVAPLHPDTDAMEAIKAQPKYNPGGKFDYIAFISDNPQFQPWTIAGSESSDTSFESWAKVFDLKDDSTLLHKRTQKDADKWSAELAERDRESRAWREFKNIGLWPDYLGEQKDALYEAWNKKYPKYASNELESYNRDVELVNIEGSLHGAAKDRALNVWRQRYDVSFPNYQRMATAVRGGTLLKEFNPWTGSRSTDDVAADIQKQVKRSVYTQTYEGRINFEGQLRYEQGLVSRLPVTEQIKYWDWKMSNMRYGASNDPALVMDQYYAVRNLRNDLYQTPPMKLYFANKAKDDTQYEEAINKANQSYRDQKDVYQAELTPLIAAIEKYKARGGTYYYDPAYKALVSKRNALYDLIKQTKDQWYKGIPDPQGMFDDIRAVMMFTANGNFDAIKDIEKYRKEWGFFVTSDEQKGYLNMPSGVKDAFIKELVDGLEIPPGDYTDGKKFWKWLTEFQQDLLEKNLPKSKIDEWKGQEAGQGSGKGKGRGNWVDYGRRGSAEDDELSYAYAMFKQYGKRGEGAKAPHAYAEYLTLPNDAVLRSAFLKLHPEVGDWIRLGPMANMPPVLQMMVADIMIRSGKWEGESRTMTEITEIGFAKEQLARWTKRGDRTAPPEMQDWLNMPTGEGKAQYLRDHPAIGEWMQLGPMANMPEAYREVVRDIMYRYQLWTDNQDPLGKVISGYFQVPSYARDQYMADHPELPEYWKATRSAEDQARFALSDQYFSIADPNARRAFLQVHPELQEWFLNQRQKRYETFLNQVAVYMGTNPELFTAYLDRQEAVLSDLLHKFSEMPLMRERYVMRDSTVKSRRVA